MIDWIPVLFLLILLGGSYYIFAILLCLIYLIIDGVDTGSGITFFTIAHVILVFLVWSLIQAIRTDPGHPKSEMERNPELANVSIPIHGECMTCHFWKPYRAYHCSSCHCCVLRMDHHCPWLNNCVGFYNHKFYYLFLFYTILYGLFIIPILIIEGIHFFNLSSQAHSDSNSSSPLAWTASLPFFLSSSPSSSSSYGAAPYIFIIFAGVFSLILFSVIFLWTYHTYLILYNKTTIENIREGDASCYNRLSSRKTRFPLSYSLEPFDFGKLENWKMASHLLWAEEYDANS